VLFDLPEALSRGQASMHCEPPLGVAKVRQVESAEPGHCQARLANNKVALWSSGAASVTDTQVERLPAPFGEDFDRVVERAGIRGAEFE